MGTEMDARKGWRLVVPVVALLFGVTLIFGLFVTQSHPASAYNSHSGISLAPAATPPGCVPGWRIVDSPSPNPTSSFLYRVDAYSSSDIWAVGQAGPEGLAEHWDGSTWSAIPLPPPPATYTITGLNDVSVVSSNDVWAVGRYQGPSAYLAATFHWDGSTWTAIPVPEALQSSWSFLLGVDAVSSNDVWAVGLLRSTGYYDSGLTMHWDGTAWSVVPNPLTDSTQLRGVAAIASNDVWAVGGSSEGLLMHWDGTAWSLTPAPMQVSLTDISASASNDVWAVGYTYNSSSVILHWDGTAWTQSLGIISVRLMGIGAVAPDDVWAVDVASGKAMHWDGTQWSMVTLPRPYPYGGSLIDVVASSPTEVWGVGSHRVSSSGGEQTLTMRFTASCPSITPTPVTCNTGWTALDSPNRDAQANTLRAVAVVSPSDIWAMGSSGPSEYRPLSLHWDGHAWGLVPMPDAQTGAILYAVSAVASDDVWAVGRNNSAPAQILTMHWNGSAWSIVPGPNIGSGSVTLTGLSSISYNDVWAVGVVTGVPLALHWNGTQWSVVPTPAVGSLQAIAAVSADDVWAVSSSTSASKIMHWNGSVWSVVPCSCTSGTRLYGVDAISSNDVWAVGYNGYLPVALHWDGAGWADVPVPGDISGELFAVSAASDNDVWAVGEAYNAPLLETLVMHWDGTQWARVPSPNVDGRFNELYGVAAVSQNEAWAVGDQGDFNDGGVFTLIERYVGSCITPTQTNTPTYTPIATTTATPSITPQATNTRTPTVAATTTAASTATASPTGTQSAPTSTQTAMVTATAIVTSTPTLCTVTFSDVPFDHTFYSFIRCLACKGIISGYSDGTFRPGGDITRSQIAKMVSNAAGLNDSAGEQIYEDVDPSSPFYLWVNRLSRLGYMGGYSCGSVPEEACVAPGNRPYFRPYANATRGQLAKIVSSAASISGDPTGVFYSDVQEDHPFYVWIMRLTDSGVMSGYPCGGEGEPCDDANRPYFRPYNNVTRGQASKIVANTFFPNCQTPVRP